MRRTRATGRGAPAGSLRERHGPGGLPEERRVAEVPRPARAPPRVGPGAGEPLASVLQADADRIDRGDAVRGDADPEWPHAPGGSGGAPIRRRNKSLQRGGIRGPARRGIGGLGRGAAAVGPPARADDQQLAAPVCHPPPCSTTPPRSPKPRDPRKAVPSSSWSDRAWARKGSTRRPSSSTTANAHTDFPGAALFKSQGIHRVFYINPRGVHQGCEEDDLSEYFTALGTAGIQFTYVKPGQGSNEMALVTPMPRQTIFSKHVLQEYASSWRYHPHYYHSYPRYHHWYWTRSSGAWGGDGAVTGGSGRSSGFSS